MLSLFGQAAESDWILQMAKALITNKARLLYNHTQTVELSRISAETYREHLNKLACERWGCNLPDVVFDKLMSYSQRHPYYVNRMCKVVLSASKLPSDCDIDKGINGVVDVDTNRGRIRINRVRDVDFIDLVSWKVLVMEGNILSKAQIR